LPGRATATSTAPARRTFGPPGRIWSNSTSPWYEKAFCAARNFDIARRTSSACGGAAGGLGAFTGCPPPPAPAPTRAEAAPRASQVAILALLGRIVISALRAPPTSGRGRRQLACIIRNSPRSRLSVCDRILDIPSTLGRRQGEPLRCEPLLAAERLDH